MSTAFSNLVKFAIGGGWGADTASEGRVGVRVIRGADFPSVGLQDSSELPVRFESAAIVESRALMVGDIVLEASGGTKDRPTGRVVRVTERLLAGVATPVIPASFCRLLRPDSDVVDPTYLYFHLADWWNRGGSWAYQNVSTGLSNFQYRLFSSDYRVTLPSLREQRAIGEVGGVIAS